MFLVVEYARGFTLVHLAWLFFFLIGTLLRTPKLGSLADDWRAMPAEALLKIVLSTISGIAIFGFITFFIGLFGGLYPITIILVVAAIGVGFAYLGDSPLRSMFWISRYRLVRKAVTLPAAIVYFTAIFISLAAVLPETAFDPLFSYHVSALDWVTAHRLVVDEWRRMPHYPLNWVLLNTWVFEFHLNRYVDFLTWLAGCLSLLGVYGYVAHYGEGRDPNLARPARIAGLLAAASLAVAPVFLRWDDTGMIDVPTGMLFLGATLAAGMAFTSRRREWLFGFIVCVGFLAGMKVSLFVFVPPALLVVWLLCRRLGVNRSRTVLFACVLVLLSLPWYAKTFIETGDPISPTLTLLLHGHDAKWTRADMAGQLSDLTVDQTPMARLHLPVDIFERPDAIGYREPGVTLMLSLLVIPGFVSVLGLFGKRQLRASARFLDASILLFAISYWLLTSHLARYTLLFYPSLAAFVALMALQVCGQSSKRLWLMLPILALLVLPSPSSGPFYTQYWQNNYLNIDSSYTDPATYLATHLGAYPEEEYISKALIASHRADDHVYEVLVNDTNYYFKLHGITAIGDWFGPERYSDFARSIDRDGAAAFLRNLDVAAVLLAPPSQLPFMTPAEYEELKNQLTAAGYIDETRPGRPYAIFLSSSTHAISAPAPTLRPSLLHAYSRTVSKPHGVMIPVKHATADVEPVATPRYSFSEHYADGRINSDAPAATPNKRGAFILPITAAQDFGPSLTVLSSYRYSYRVTIRPGDELAFKAAKVLNIGIGAAGFVEITDRGAKQRLFSAVLRPADSSGPHWLQFHESLQKYTGRKVVVTFGTDAVDGNATAAWVSYLHAGIYGTATSR